MDGEQGVAGLALRFAILRMRVDRLDIASSALVETPKENRRYIRATTVQMEMSRCHSTTRLLPPPVLCCISLSYSRSHTYRPRGIIHGTAQPTFALSLFQTPPARLGAEGVLEARVRGDKAEEGLELGRAGDDVGGCRISSSLTSDATNSRIQDSPSTLEASDAVVMAT